MSVGINSQRSLESGYRLLELARLVVVLRKQKMETMVGLEAGYRLFGDFDGFRVFLLLRMGVAEVEPKFRILRVDFEAVPKDLDAAFEIFLPQVRQTQVYPSPSVIGIKLHHFSKMPACLFKVLARQETDAQVEMKLRNLRQKRQGLIEHAFRLRMPVLPHIGQAQADPTAGIVPIDSDALLSLVDCLIVHFVFEVDVCQVQAQSHIVRQRGHPFFQGGDAFLQQALFNEGVSQRHPASRMAGIHPEGGLERGDRLGMGAGFLVNQSEVQEEIGMRPHDVQALFQRMHGLFGIPGFPMRPTEADPVFHFVPVQGDGLRQRSDGPPPAGPG